MRASLNKMSTPTELHAVLFDLDGTLIDTAPDFAIAVNQLRQQNYRDPLPFQSIRETVSQGSKALITLAFQRQEGDHGFEDLRQQLLDLYSRHLAVETALFPGISDLLAWLEQRRIPWGIVTNKPRRYAEPILSFLDLNQRCSTLVCPDDVSNTKPHPEPMFLACDQIACIPENTIYVGDHRRDIEAGTNAAMTTIAANYGYIERHDPTVNWNADFYVDHAQEIQPLLQANFLLPPNTDRR